MPLEILNKLMKAAYVPLFAALLFFAGCGTDAEPGMGSLQVRMYDAPIDSADAVNVHVDRVEVNKTGSAGEWSVINTPDKTYNLIELANGAYEVLGDTTLEVGTYQQIRLVLSQDGHSVEVDGSVYDMIVPSGAQTGIKLNVNAEIVEDIQYVLLLDFDASQSVVKAGQNNPSVEYLLKPVIRANNQAVTGNIGGIVDPAEAHAVVYAIANSDTLASTVADTSDGSFRLVGLEEGTYDVAFDPRNDNYESADTTGVDVVVGETTNLGTIQLQQSGVL